MDGAYSITNGREHPHPIGNLKDGLGHTRMGITHPPFMSVFYPLLATFYSVRIQLTRQQHFMLDAPHLPCQAIEYGISTCKTFTYHLRPH